MTKSIIRAFKSVVLVGMWQWPVPLLNIRLNRFLFYQFECLLHGQQWTKCWV
uniref:Uncharacterized protein n=1 Tax=Cebus imitator TaxID=2715852 RepID=A0A2K5QHC1_CEBIM